MKLNVGCGYDYREGFVNIDGDGTLPRVDQVIDLSAESVRRYYGPGSESGPLVDHVLASDFIEHHFHWEAVRLIADFFAILKPGGTIEFRLPDFLSIINGNHPVRQKIMMLFGGQDIPQGESDPSHRQKFPQYFAHKYAYTIETMSEELRRAGFDQIEARPAGTNFIITARKPLGAE
jgi:predicted SAM-dependent methyltransferase